LRHMLSSPTIGETLNLFLLHDRGDTNHRLWIRACQNPILVNKIRNMIGDIMQSGVCKSYRDIHNILSKRIRDEYGYCPSNWAFYNWFRGRYPIPLYIIKELLCVWKEICGESNGEFLAVAQELLKEIDYLQVASGSNKVRIPIKLTDELAYFLGIIIGDGSLPNGRMREICIRKGNKEFMEEIYPQLVARLFDIKIRTKYAGKDNTYDASFGSRVIFRYVTKIFRLPSGPKAKIAEVPRLVLFSKPSVKASFLRGFFDTDGGISGGKDIEFSTSSKKLFEETQELLKEFGLNPRPYTHHDKRYDKLHYYLFIRRPETRAFMEVIGSCNPKRIAAFNAIKQKS